MKEVHHLVKLHHTQQETKQEMKFTASMVGELRKTKSQTNMNRKEKQEAKAERYRALARSSRQKADDACRQSNAAVENIPFGQPIHVGHHSEKAHRRAIEKSRQQMGKCVEYSNRAEYYEAKARSAELNNSIYLGDDDSVERLQAKLDALVEK